jgi:hypothetical protein
MKLATELRSSYLQMSKLARNTISQESIISNGFPNNVGMSNFYDTVRSHQQFTSDGMQDQISKVAFLVSKKES